MCSASAITICVSPIADRLGAGGRAPRSEARTNQRMKVCVFGAGALGCVYGVRLAVRGNVDVAFVVRPARVSSTDPIVIERVRGNLREAIDAPLRSEVVPSDADVVLLAVGTEDLEALR